MKIIDINSIHWISVNDALPTEYADCLFCNGSGEVYEGEYKIAYSYGEPTPTPVFCTKWTEVEYGVFDIIHEGVTHWCIPEYVEVPTPTT